MKKKIDIYIKKGLTLAKKRKETNMFLNHYKRRFNKKISIPSFSDGVYTVTVKIIYMYLE